MTPPDPHNWPLADFRLVVGPAYGSRMVAIQICADRACRVGFNGSANLQILNFQENVNLGP
jgi:hypothetical protein